MKIALLDQACHKKTGSNKFFTELLGRLGSVQCYYVDENLPSLLAEVADMNCDLVVLWQTEFCAPYFLARGQRTLIVPMYDGCGGLPNLYFKAVGHARAVSFCQIVHNRLQENGGDSAYLQYFPDPGLYRAVQDFSDLRGFLWQRQPKGGAEWKQISTKCRNLHSLHIHLGADDGHNGPDIVAPHVTISRWEADGSAYAQALMKANVFFAPRRSEGIGMASLEAMARGMCVAAHDDATANEYIIDGVNGRLYDIFKSKEIELDHALAEKFGRAARKTVEIGREKYASNIEGILGFIASTPKPNPRYAASFPAKEFIRAAYKTFSDVNTMLSMLATAEQRGAFIDEDKFFYEWEHLKAYTRHLPFMDFARWRLYPRLKRVYIRYRSRLRRARG